MSSKVAVADIRAFARGLTEVAADDLPTQDGLDAVRELERVACGLRLALAAKASKEELWKSSSASSEADWWAAQTGRSTGAAGAELATAQVLDTVGELGAVVRAGRLSGDQAVEIASVAAQATDEQLTGLIEMAEQDSFSQLKAEASRIRGNGCTALQARRAWERRSVRVEAGSEGQMLLRAQGPGGDLVRISGVLDARADELFKDDKRRGVRRSSNNRRYDAFLGLAGLPPLPEPPRPGLVAGPAAPAPVPASPRPPIALSPPQPLDPPSPPDLPTPPTPPGLPTPPTPPDLPTPPTPPAPPTPPQPLVPPTPISPVSPASAAPEALVPELSSAPASSSGSLARLPWGTEPEVDPDRHRPGVDRAMGGERQLEIFEGDPASTSGPTSDGEGGPRADGCTPLKGLLRVDHAALVRGYLEPGDICDFNELQALPVATLLALCGGAHLSAVVTRTDGTVEGVALFGSKFTRRATDPQWLVGGPRAPGPMVSGRSGLRLVVHLRAGALPIDPPEIDTSFVAQVARRRSADALITVGRGCNAAQTAVLDWAQPTCRVLGCNHTANTENDHRIDWIRCRITDFKNIDRLCPFHHRQKTFHGYRLVEGTGRRRFVRGPPIEAAG